MIDRRLDNLRKDFTAGLIERDEYREQAQVLRQQSEDLFIKAQQIII